MHSEPIVVWGGGAIGGTLAAYWARAGHPVLMVDVEPQHIHACNTAGLAITGPVDTFTQVIRTVTPDALGGRFGRIVLAVKATATEPALAQLLPHLREDGFVLSAQNGLNEIVIARVAGQDRTMGCFVNFAADWLGPGEILFGSRGTLVVGELDGSIRPRTHAMHELLQVFEPKAILSDNIWGHLWGKLGYLSMVYATALTNHSMLDHFDNPAHFPVFLKLGREVMAVARARGVKPVGFSGFEPAAFAPVDPGAKEDEAPARASMAALVAFRRGSAKTHSGIWRDLAVRKRRTEVDSQIALVAQLGEEAGIHTPALRCLAGLIHDIEEGRRDQSDQTFQVLIDLCH